MGSRDVRGGDSPFSQARDIFRHRNYAGDVM